MANDPRPIVETIYGEKGPPAPVADLTQTGAVFGCSSAGPLETLTTLTTEADLDPFGYGPGVVAASEQLRLGGAPVYFSRTKSTTAGSSGTVTKTPGNPVGTPVNIGAGTAGVRYVANQQGVTVQHINPGALTANTTVAVNAKAIAVTLKHDGTNIVATADEVRAAVAASVAAMALLASVANVQAPGNGTAVAQAATPLPFGSAGTLTVTVGAAFDAHEIVVQVKRGGTVGAQPYPSLVWSADRGDDEYKKGLQDKTLGGSFSGEIVIPANGVVQLKDFELDTGVTVTLAGALDAGDTWRFDTVAPVTSQSDMVVALRQALNDMTRAFGFGHIHQPVDLAAAVAYNTEVQGVKAFPLYRPMQLFIGFRDINFGAGETEDQWGDAIVNDFDGVTPFVSDEGRVVAFGGFCRHYSARTGRYYWRSLSLPAAARRASRPVHEDLGKVGDPPKPIANVVQLRHDEATKLIFSGHRMTSAMTHVGVGIFFAATKALAAQGSRYGRQPIGAVMNQVAKICVDRGRRYLLDNAVGDPETGAISIEEAVAIEDTINQVVGEFLYRAKADNKVSATPPPDGQKNVVVRRDYNFLQTNELRLQVNVWHVGYFDKVRFELNVVTPGRQ